MNFKNYLHKKKVMRTFESVCKTYDISTQEVVKQKKNHTHTYRKWMVIKSLDFYNLTVSEICDIFKLSKGYVEKIIRMEVSNGR